MRWAGAVVLAALAGGCTSVRMVQREGCWVRQTDRWPGRVTEEVGPCARATPAWVDDRLTRMVQECVAQADYRWQGRALEAWNKGEPLPPQESEEAVQRECMGEVLHGLATEHEALQRRFSEVRTERDALRAAVEKDREFLRTSHTRLGEALGEAAKKPAPAAVATATAHGDGSAVTSSDMEARASGEGNSDSQSRGAAQAPGQKRKSSRLRLMKNSTAGAGGPQAPASCPPTAPAPVPALAGDAGPVPVPALAEEPAGRPGKKESPRVP